MQYTSIESWFRFDALILKYVFTFHRLCTLACCDSELTSGIVNHFRYFDRTTWTEDRPIAGPLPTQGNPTKKKKNRGHTDMRRAVFEPTTPLFERPKTIRFLDRAPTRTGLFRNLFIKVM
jgi:hypothetical protein